MMAQQRSDTMIFNYKIPNSSVSPNYGREIYIKNLPPDVSEGWLLEYICRFGTPVQIRHFRPNNQAHVKFSTFEEACLAVEGTTQHNLVLANGASYHLNVSHSRDFPFVVFSHFRHDFNYDSCREVFGNFFGADHVVDIQVKPNKEVVVEFDNYEFARHVVNTTKKLHGKTLMVENQPLYVRWQRIPVLVVLGLRWIDTNHDVEKIFFPRQLQTQHQEQQQQTIKRVVRKAGIAYVWFHEVDDAINAMDRIKNGKATTCKGTCVEISWMGKE